METRHFNIPSENRSLVEVQIEKLNRRAKKLNLPEITLTWGKAFLEERSVKGEKKNVLVIPVELTGALNVSYEGWTFTAVLQHLSTGENIIRTIADNNWIIPSVYYNSGSQCEHCRVNRYRKDTYLVVRENDGKVFQLGSSCIKDFLGGNSPDDLLKKASLIADTIEFMTGAGTCHSSNNDELFYITNFLAHTAAVIRQHGWVSKKTAREMGTTPTVVRVMSNIEEASFGTLPCPILPEDQDKANRVVEWAENLSDQECETEEYLHNLRAIARSGMAGQRTAGFAASMVNAYDKDIAKKHPKKWSCYVGQVGDRGEFELVLKNKYSGVSAYGSYDRYTFHDQEGNIMIWTTSSQTDLEVNKKYRIKGTIKDHSEYKNVEQTIINSCKVIVYYD